MKGSRDTTRGREMRPSRIEAPVGPGAGGRGIWARVLLSALPHGAKGLTLLELCAPDSRVAWYLRVSLGPTIATYLATHPAAPRARRLNAAVWLGRAQPERLPYDDRSIDVVCGLGVLGCSADPIAAAAEATRVARRRVVFLERNGLSLRWLPARFTRPRPGQVAHPPWRLRSWFPESQFAWLGLRPVPLREGADRRTQRTAGLRWHYGGVLIVGERRAPFAALSGPGRSSFGPTAAGQAA